MQVYLGKEDARPEWEQLWSKMIADGRAIVCCIPFFARDLSLGDEVEVEDFVVQRVVSRAGNSTFRMWLGDSNYERIREELIAYFQERGLEHEWYSGNLLAVAVPDEMAQQVADFLWEREGRGELAYETGRTQ